MDSIMKMMQTMDYAIRVIDVMSKTSLHLAELCAKHNVPIDAETQALMLKCDTLLREMTKNQHDFKNKDSLI